MEAYLFGHSSVMTECLHAVDGEEVKEEDDDVEDGSSVPETSLELAYLESVEGSVILSVPEQCKVSLTEGESFSMAEEIEGQRRGSSLVMADGFLYRRNYRNSKNDKNYLLCNQRYEHPHCYARAIMQNGMIKLTKPHNHFPDPIKVEQLKMKSRCKKRVEEEVTSIRDIVEEEQASGSFDVHPNFYGTLAKRRKSLTPSIPKTIDQFIQILQENEERFCSPSNSSLYFSGFITADDFSVAILFSPSFNDVLDSVSTVHIDRMYSSVPSLYNHLCTILITFNNNVYPLVYGLMTSYSEASYTILFTFVKQQLPNLNFKEVILDYDEPINNAVKSSYPLADICGGFIHYAMAVWREVKVKGLVSAYTDSREAQMCIRMLLSLPLLPPEYEEVALAVVQEKLLELDPPQSRLQDVLDYVQECWLDNLDQKRFSVHGELQRSSLDVDAYLTKLKNKLGNSAGNIWHFIDRLKNFQESERKEFEKLCKGCQKRRKSACLNMNSKIREVIEKLKEKKMDIGSGLSSIALQVQPPTNCSMEMYMDLHPTRVMPRQGQVFQLLSFSQEACTSEIK